MNTEELKREYVANDAKRLLDPMFETDIVRLRRKLSNILPGERVNVKCFNEADRDVIKDQLTPQERPLVIFSWLVFHGPR